jgi:ABC-type lipoprotein release transport system permease subunit
VYALSSLRRRFTRVVFTVLGVALSIALTVTMFSIGEGLRLSTEDLVRSTEVDLFVISNGSTYLLGRGELPDSIQLSDEIQADLGADALTVCPRFEPERGMYLLVPGEPDAKPVSAHPNGFVPELVGRIVGGQGLEGEHFAVPDDPFREDVRYQEGNYTPEAFANFTHEVQVNRALAKALGVGPGDTVVVSAHYDMHDNVSCVVRGVYTADFEGTDARSFRIHLSELQYMLKRWDDPATELLIDLAPGVSASEAKAFLSEGRPYSPLITVSTGRDLYMELEGVYDTFQGFADLIAVITIVVAMLFISTVMVISVKERTHELGVLRAIGFSRDSVFTLVLAEGFIISAVGFALGLVLGYMDAWVVDTWIKRSVSGLPAAIHITHITPLVILQVTLVGLLIGAVAGLLPAHWATRVEVARTLRHE